MTTTPPQHRLFTPAFIALGVAELAYFTAVGVPIYALPVYVTGPLGGDEAAAGVAYGAFAISALALRPFAGRLSDRRGRLPLLIGGALVAAASLALLAVAANLVVVVLLRLLAGVAEAAFFVAAFAALADLAPPSRMGEALSYNSLGLYLGIAFGPPLGEILVERWGFAAAWYGAAALAVVAAGLSLRVGETRQSMPPADGPRRILHRPAIPIALGFVATLAASGGFLAFSSLHAHRIGLDPASLALLVYGGTVVVCRIAFARIPDRLPSLPLAAASLAVMALGIGIVAIWPAPAGMLVGVVVLAVGITFSTPAFFSAIFATASPAERGTASGTASAALDLGLGIGPILLGFLAEPYGIPWAFAAAAGVALAGGAWTLHLARRARPQAA
ncbi:MFS transporter [Agromyces aurantiacus]|uniref:MFS transporter n=1 Tax=Agromyces aurantiacus TaxID=165814 RepID=A0ABV9R830_9MICO|nr:MFS transporter [Agromyces aurantiacus]MBM7504780.1 putative MFS family arabinose efflux permease [Agromyces aurantiacus]